jgi:hypothetical protein
LVLGLSVKKKLLRGFRDAHILVPEYHRVFREAKLRVRVGKRDKAGRHGAACEAATRHSGPVI